jgi:hypothetical protein
MEILSQHTQLLDGPVLRSSISMTSTSHTHLVSQSRNEAAK